VCIQENFESLFRHYEANAQFQYLKSFRRARIMFESIESATAAHRELYNHEFHGQQIKCYYAQVGLCIYCADSCLCTTVVLGYMHTLIRVVLTGELGPARV